MILVSFHYSMPVLTLKAPITTAADDNFCNIFTYFLQKVRYDRYIMRIGCQQTILMKYHALFVIFVKRQNSKLSSAANYRWRFKGKSGMPGSKEIKLWPQVYLYNLTTYYTTDSVSVNIRLFLD